MARFLVVAGEASGDALLAPVVARLVAAGHDVVGVGGDASAAAGLGLLGHARELAAHGLVEAVGTAPAFLGVWRRLRAALAGVDAALLVDFPELNRRLLAQAPVPVAWLAPPQAWAWRPWRARDVARAAWVGCLFPFEVEWFRSRGVSAEWVGHPLAEAPAPGLGAGVALLPGSRDAAVRRLLPVMLAALARLRRGRPDLEAHLAIASTVDRGWIQRAVAASGLPVHLAASAPAALAASRIALAGAGTATLEAALAGRPPVTLAALHPASAAVARRLVRVPWVGLPNLVLGRGAFPECVQAGCTAAAVAAAAAGLLDAPPTADVAALRARCGRPGLADRVTARLLALAP
ncbi:MAG: hypothetical protein H6706_02000 [Myxococcales bacterium]|nr:hypothetical protein [Myxococcales bacterium]